ncbi:MAG: hypothetical protein OXD43_00695 [Bacteroidetes bacterium]|nr:hypothetical protein [Bacteroidota bacterium]
MKAIVFSALIGLLAFSAIAQPKSGLHLKDGTWIAPTPQSALDVISMNTGRIDYAIAVLRQTHSKHKNAELDAFADKLVSIFLEGEFGMSATAATVLNMAGKDHGEGMPYERSKHLFMSIYEEKKGADVIMATRALSGVFHSGGESMIRDMFHKSIKPAQACNPSMRVNNRDGSKVDPKTRCPYYHEPWCDAGNILVLNLMNDKPVVSPVSTDPTPDDILPHCFGQFKEGDKWPLVLY